MESAQERCSDGSSPKTGTSMSFTGHPPKPETSGDTKYENPPRTCRCWERFAGSPPPVPQGGGNLQTEPRRAEIDCGRGVTMRVCKEAPSSGLLLFLFIGLSSVWQCFALDVEANQTALLLVNASTGRPIPETLFGIFFEEINHAGAGGLWAELVSNRGFEAGGPNTPSNIDPWLIIGDESFLVVSTDRQGGNTCPAGGVGVYNPGFWGMNIEEGRHTKWSFMFCSSGSINVSVSLTGSSGTPTLAAANIRASAPDISNWTKMEVLLQAKESNTNSRLQLTTTNKGVIWFDQVSAMPLATYKLAEDLKTRPIWVFNNGISLNDQVDSSVVWPFIQEALDGIEFARGDPNSTWGSLRAQMGHPEPFDLRYVAIGNEECGLKNYLGSYLKFHSAIKSAYPDIKMISNCDGSSQPLDHPADFYDFHVYTSAKNLFSMAHKFDTTSRAAGPKAFVSEYAVTGNDAGTGSLLAGLAEAGFLIGLEKNSDIVEMASYAPLFVNSNDRRWNPDAIVFDSSRLYGTPSYWVQRFFTESSGATLLDTTIQASSDSSLLASAITWTNSEDKKSYIRIKIVNFGSSLVNLTISISGLDQNSIQKSGSSKMVLTSANLMDENSFSEPNKVVPIQSLLENAGKEMDVVILPYSFTSFDLLKESTSIRIKGDDHSSRSSI
ncbi:hypothetical protein NL676_017085 [Syzygium grande]|nr:hypothetical protein NL676_017085 [Syzygium grande]